MSNELKLEGIVHKILPVQSGQGSRGNWLKQGFVIETTDQYPKKIFLEAWGEKAEAAGKLVPGSKVKVWFNPESREYNDRWYTELKAWKLEVLQEAPKFSEPEKTGLNLNSGVDDDLPF